MRTPYYADEVSYIAAVYTGVEGEAVLLLMYTVCLSASVGSSYISNSGDESVSYMSGSTDAKTAIRI